MFIYIKKSLAYIFGLAYNVKMHVQVSFSFVNSKLNEKNCLKYIIFNTRMRSRRTSIPNQMSYVLSASYKHTRAWPFPFFFYYCLVKFSVILLSLAIFYCFFINFHRFCPFLCLYFFSTSTPLYFEMILV